MKLLVLALLSALLWGEDVARMRFTADKYIRKTKEEKVILIGTVKIVKGKSVLKADNVELNTRTETFVATGHVVFHDEKIKIESEKLEGDMNSPEGLISQGKITSGQDIFEADKIHRVTRKNFKLKEGSHTSCKNSPPDWRLYGNDIDLTSGEYARMNNVVVEAFGLPVAYIPYMVLPIKYERQSGLLPPRFGFGTDGFNIHESFFWAISRSYDSTFTLGHYGNRGLKEGIEFRSAFSEESNNNLYYFHISDKKFAGITIDGAPIGTDQRHGFKFDQQLKLYDDTYVKTKLLYASDANIPRDFPEEMEGRADPALESKLTFMTKTSNVSYSTDLAYYQDMLSKNPRESNKDQLQRLPEIRASIAKTKFSAFLLESDFSYLDVYRSGPFFDDYYGTGVYQDGDFIRKGQRLDIYPRVSMPITTSFVKITPQVGMRYDHYMLPIDGDANRGYIEIKNSVLSEISRVYQRNKDKQIRAIKHTIEPFIDYQFIPKVSQSNHPFFTAQHNNITAPMFDSIDTIGKTNTVTYGITNRLLMKSINNFVPPKTDTKPAEDKKCETCDSEKAEAEMTKSTQEQFLGLRTTDNKKQKKDLSKKGTEEEDFTVIQPLQWRLYQSYNFLDTTGRPFGYIYSDIWATYMWLSLTLSNFYNTYTKKLGVNSQLGVRWNKTYANIGYYADKTDINKNTNQINMAFGFNLWRFGTNARFIVNYALPQKVQDKYLDISYNPPSSCWFLMLAANAPYDRPGVDVSFTFNLLISGQTIGFSGQNTVWNKFY